MKRIQLVVTGKCEQSLPTALRRLFPQLDWLPAIYSESFTSTSLREPIPSRLKETIDKFAETLLRNVDEDDERMIIGIDDVEQNAPGEIVAAVVAACGRQVARLSGAGRRERIAAKLVERCSFHLLRPMVEAYFFGDPPALVRAGQKRPSRFDPADCDIESFEVLDLDHRPDPERHPKRYLRFLANDDYRETKGGRKALEELDWLTVIANESHATAVRALLNDISEFCDRQLNSGTELFETSRATQRAYRTLRNC